MWNYLNPLRCYTGHGGVLYSCWAIDMLRVKIDLTPSELSMLAYLYQVTDRGKSTIHSDIIYKSVILPHIQIASKQGILNDLKHRGYISRYTHNSSAPYLQRSFSRQPVFIRLTLKGISVIQGIEKDLYKLLLNTSLDEITGANKKTFFIEPR
jgi:DNA-binding MarR family transcriptional regulator